MTHGYYLAATRTRHGNPELARMARLVWRKLGHRGPSRVCGASVWTTPSGYEVRIIARDLFGDATVQYKPYPPFTVPRVHVKS